MTVKSRLGYKFRRLTHESALADSASTLLVAIAMFNRSQFAKDTASLRNCRRLRIALAMLPSKENAMARAELERLYDHHFGLSAIPGLARTAGSSGAL